MNSDAIDVASYIDTVIASGAIHQVSDARVVTDGSQHLVFVLDNDLVARFPRNPGARTALRAEIDLLTHLAHQISAPIPVPVHVDEDFTLHRMLHGSTTTRAALAGLERRRSERLLDDVAQFLAELAAASIPNLTAGLGATSTDRLARLKARAMQHVVPLMWQHQREWFDELFETIEQTPFDAPPSVIHGDLAPYHVLHDPNTGALTGVLDFGVAGLGDPATDLACLLTVWGERFSDRLLATFTDEQHVERARLLASVLPLEWAVLAIEESAPDMGVAHLGHVAFDIRPQTRRVTS